MHGMDELDPRFSDPDAQATPWSDVRDALATAETSWITTVRADGRPHVTPLVAVWMDDALWVCTGPDEQKAVNLRSNPNVAVTTGCNGWSEGLDVVVEGEATRVTDEDVLRRLAAAWREKWDGRWQFDVGDGAFLHEAGQAWVFRIDPTKILSFAKGTFAATRHRR